MQAKISQGSTPLKTHRPTYKEYKLMFHFTIIMAQQQSREAFYILFLKI